MASINIEKIKSKHGIQSIIQHNKREHSRYSNICPAYAGMILVSPIVGYNDENLSRVCGDDPATKCILSLDDLFVPRMRG